MSVTALCVHGHFYQPPREDPLTGEIPLEPGASPYNNWNERILAECYAPNALAGNMGRISFNVGPTLFRWLEMTDERTGDRIIAQDRMNLEKYGVGNAIAQSYHHTILPLATYQDKVTQVRWGIADFKYRFGHRPSGMWLPETAADNETLSVLADHGIEFTILAPWQALDRDLDTSHPYRVELPGGRSIVVFFYNQALSTRVSFDAGATVNADWFARDLVLPQFQHRAQPDGEPELIMIASDGELYGHHQKSREKFLAYLLDGALKNSGIEFTYPALWLKKHPAFRTTSIVQNSSWSCHHGVARWMGPCDCTPNGAWKAYMRQAFDRIANAIDEVYVNEISAYVEDPWELRHRYIHVLQGQTSLEDLASDMAGRHLDPAELDKISTLLCAQNERQRMFTSCGWFFDDFDRIEPRNAVAYTAQAVWLTNLATGIDLAPQALGWLHQVRAWRSKLSADKVFANHLQRAQEHPQALMKCAR
jgi:alpha-amylase/alpha-mannosidase (GH57 family)